MEQNVFEREREREREREVLVYLDIASLNYKVDKISHFLNEKKYTRNEKYR